MIRWSEPGALAAEPGVLFGWYPDGTLIGGASAVVVFAVLDELDYQAGAPAPPDLGGVGRLDELDFVAGGQTVGDELTDDDIIAFRWAAGDRMVINVVRIRYDFDAVSGEFTKENAFLADDSLMMFGKRPELLIESQGFHPVDKSPAPAAVQQRALTVFKRFANPPPVLEVEVFYRRHTWEVGDLIRVSSAFIPNVVTGRLGLDGEVFEIIQQRVEFAPTGKLVMTLLDVEALTPQTAPTVVTPGDSTPGASMLSAQIGESSLGGVAGDATVTGPAVH